MNKKIRCTVNILFFSMLILCIVPGSNTCIANNTPHDAVDKIKKEAISPRDEFNRYQRLLNHYLSDKGQFDSIGEISQRMLQLARTMNNDSMHCIAYSSMSNYFMHKGNYKLSLQYLLSGMHLAEEIGYKSMICSFYSDASILYNSLENYNESLKYLRKAVKYIPEKGQEHSYLSAQVYANMALTFVKMNKADSALRYIQWANEKTLSFKSAFGNAYILYIFGMVYEALENFPMAENYFNTSLDLCEKENITYLLSIVAQQYGQFLFKQGRFIDARNYGLLSMSRAEASGKNEWVIKSAEVLHKVYAQLKKSDSAYYYASIQINLRDSFFNQQKINELNDITFIEELLDSEQQVGRRHSEEKRKHLIQLMITGALLLMFVIFFFLFSHSVIANIKLIEILGVIGLLMIFEFINLLLHPFLMRVTNDSPLLMLGSLVGIAALLVPAHHYLEQWIKHRLTEKNKRLKIAAAKKIIEELDRPDTTNET